MHTLMVILGGLLLLGACLLIGRWSGARLAKAALAFIPLWLLAALLNLWVGVSRAGYSVAEELPIFVIVFAVPVAVATLVWWSLSRGG